MKILFSQGDNINSLNSSHIDGILLGYTTKNFVTAIYYSYVECMLA